MVQARCIQDKDIIQQISIIVPAHSDVHRTSQWGFGANERKQGPEGRSSTLRRPGEGGGEVPGSKSPPHQLGVLGECCKFPSWVWDTTLIAWRFSCILVIPVGLSWHTKLFWWSLIWPMEVLTPHQTPSILGVCGSSQPHQLPTMPVLAYTEACWPFRWDTQCKC